MTGEGKRTYGDAIKGLFEGPVQTHGHPEDERRTAVKVQEMRQAADEFGVMGRHLVYLHRMRGHRDGEREPVGLHNPCCKDQLLFAFFHPLLEQQKTSELVANLDFCHGVDDLECVVEECFLLGLDAVEQEHSPLQLPHMATKKLGDVRKGGMDNCPRSVSSKYCVHLVRGEQATILARVL